MEAHPEVLRQGPARKDHDRSSHGSCSCRQEVAGTAPMPRTQLGKSLQAGVNKFRNSASGLLWRVESVGLPKTPAAKVENKNDPSASGTVRECKPAGHSNRRSCHARTWPWAKDWQDIFIITITIITKRSLVTLVQIELLALP